MGKVVLKYKREVGDLSSGSIAVESDVQVEFRHQEYSKMMTEFARVLVENPECQAIVQRTDRPGLQPILLPESLSGLLRRDPVTAIREMSPPPVDVVVRDKVKAKASVGLRIGHESFAESFGERLYCRAKNGDIECPGCGMWIPTEADTENRDFMFTCWQCNEHLNCQEAGGNWWTISTTQLLYKWPSERLYFPRDWNNGRPWITKVELQNKYDSWKREKEQADD